MATQAAYSVAIGSSTGISGKWRAMGDDNDLDEMVKAQTALCEAKTTCLKTVATLANMAAFVLLMVSLPLIVLLWIAVAR